jgi:hypothetical protein
MPKPVDDYFKEVKEGNPSYSDEQAWATAWSIYCKNVNPGSDSCHQDEYLTKQASGLTNGGAAVRVAAKFLQGSWDGKLVGKDFRLSWTHDQWKLEELPMKGKRKLRVATVQTNLHFSQHGNFDAFIPDNIIRRQHISASDTYDQVKEKVSQGMADAADEVIKKADAIQGVKPGSWDFLRRTSWWEQQVYFLEVTPENVDPFNAEGKDFTVHIEWTKWSAYSPDSDMGHSGDPHYTLYEGKPTSARKLYKLLKENPGALKSIAWAKFSDWLKSNKVDYDVHHSVWH